VINIQSYASEYDRTFDFFKNYSRESVFIRQVIEAYQLKVGCIADIACGTGTHLVELAAMGYSVVGLDLDSEILAIACEKARVRGVTFASVQADMRDFKLIPPVSLTLNMFYSFQNALDNELDQKRALASIYQSLEPEGLLVMELLPEENNLRRYPEGQIFSLHQQKEPDGTELIVTSQNRIVDDFHKEVVFTYEKRQNGAVLSQDVFVSPFFRMYIEPTRRLFAQAGFAILAEYGDYAFDSPFTDQSEKLIIVARKEA